MKKKWLAVGIILLFLGTCILPATAQDTANPLPASIGNTLYVGGSGQGNYTRIQDAIDNASDGDTIYVFHGTYNETIQIDVEILSVIGEERDTTFIDANYISEAVVISRDCVVLSGFTILNAKNNCVHITEGLTAIRIFNCNISNTFEGIEFEYDGDNNWNVIENNVFYSNSCGVQLASYYDAGFNTIRNNTFVNNFHGLELGGDNNRIVNNTFRNCRGQGVYLHGGNSKIEGNIFVGNDVGIESGGSDHKIIGNVFTKNAIGLDISGPTYSIIGNHIADNSLGLLLSSGSTKVNQNNFIDNKKDAKFYENQSHENNWDTNYWSAPFYPFGYKCIFGKMRTNIQRFIQIDPEYIHYFYVPWINFDFHPAQEPYDIPEMN